jgi:5-keto 4-deoxyuronate isomerase
MIDLYSVCNFNLSSALTTTFRVTIFCVIVSTVIMSAQINLDIFIFDKKLIWNKPEHVLRSKAQFYFIDKKELHSTWWCFFGLIPSVLGALINSRAV